MTVSLCASCRKAITGSYVEALDQVWHPDCFVCARCGRSFGAQAFHVKDGRPYHADCYKEAFGLRCAACGAFIEERYVIQDSLPYHPQCHRDRFGMRCAVCGEYIESQYIRDFWGDTYCVRHQTEYSVCYVCQRPVCRRLTGGGVRYNDGRVLCRPCRDQAVDDPAQAQQILHQVQERMAHYGLDTRAVNVPLAMVALSKLVQDKDDPAQARLRGQTQTQIQTQNGQEVERHIEVVYTLGGLPPEYLESVLAHELGHVWLFMQYVEGLPQDLEEGLCNLFAYLLHQEKSSPEARHCIHLLEENPDPLYGEGFRRVRAIYERRGLPALLRGVMQHRRWPRE